MSDVLERFLRYVQVSSPSDPDNEEQTPSSACQHDMARLMGEELAALGCTDITVDEHAYVTGTFAGSPGAEASSRLMLCAHMDTAPDAPGEGVKPHIVRYEGGDLVHGIVDGEPVVTTLEQVPDLAQFVGQGIVCSDGTTLLGADDKAGVAEICALLQRLKDNPELPHPALKVAFVPDEEIGHGASLLDLDALGAAYGYTVDGDVLGSMNYECFSASEATVRIKGVMVHPGSAKNVMVNAITRGRRVPADGARRRAPRAHRGPRGLLPSHRHSGHRFRGHALVHPARLRLRRAGPARADPARYRGVPERTLRGGHRGGADAASSTATWPSSSRTASSSSTTRSRPTEEVGLVRLHRAHPRRHRRRAAHLPWPALPQPGGGRLQLPLASASSSRSRASRSPSTCSSASLQKFAVPQR